MQVDTLDAGDTLEAKVNRLRWIRWARDIYFASLTGRPDERNLCHCVTCAARRAIEAEQVVPEVPGEWADGPPRWEPPPDDNAGSYV